VVFLRGKIVYDLNMKNLPARNSIPFDSPAIYQISVLGKIDPTWSDRLEGMAICLVTVDAGSQITTLIGELTDQAALAGVLDTIYELHLPVLSVKLMTD
jgi:hypothetical protein